MPRRLPLAVAVLLTVPLISASGAASAVSAPRWQVVKRFGSASVSGQKQAVAVLGLRDVWVTDGRIHHWNGRRWRTVRPRTAGGERFVSVFGAGRRAWFVTRPDPTFQNVRLLGFDGRRWSWAPEPRRDGLAQNVGAPAALPGGDVWWPGTPAVSSVRRLRAGVWKTFQPPLYTYTVAGRRSGDLWAVGEVFDQKDPRPFIPAAAHWNGKRWSPARLPKNIEGTLRSVTVASARDAWAVGTSSGGRSTRPLILHWNGRTWNRISAPRLADPVLSTVVPDGRGGIWTASTTHLAHYSSGHWTTTRTPSGTDEITLARTPGSTTIWALAASYEHSTLLRHRG